jgi:hypothetical protein
MRRWHRCVLLTALVAIAPVLAGCADFDLDKLDVFHVNDKKKLPGERHDVFPNGVPGVTQGIPPELLKSNQAAAETGQATTALPGSNPPPPAEPDNRAAAAAAGAPAEKPSRTAAVAPANIVPESETPEKPKHKPKPKVKAKAKAKPKPKSEPAKITIQPAARQQQQQPWPAAGQQPAAPWPGTGQPNGQATGASPWPAPPAGN